jgi:DNA-binding CsgD family transcriptional regulator
LNARNLTAEQLRPTQYRLAFRFIRRLIAGYLVLSVLTVVAVVLLRDHHSMVTPAVWVRSVIVVASAAVMTAFAAKAADGHARSYLRLVAAGNSNREVAAKLFISVATVKTHLLNLYTKLDVNDRAAAVGEAFNRGLLKPGRDP